MSRPLEPGTPGPERVPWPTPGPGPSNADAPGDVDRPIREPVPGSGPAPVPGPGPTPDPIEGDAPDTPPRHPKPREVEQEGMDIARGVDPRTRAAVDELHAALSAFELSDAGSEQEQPRASAEPGRPGGRADVNRRGNLREILGHLVSRVTAAERAMRDTQASASDASPAGAATERVERRRFSPFKAGFFGGVGLLLAYMSYLALDTIRSTLIVIAVALLLAIGLDPAVRWFERRRLRRGLAVLIVFIMVIAAIAAAFFAIIPPIIEQLSAFIVSLPQTLQNLLQNPTIKDLDENFGIIKQIQSSSFVQDITSNAASGILTGAATIAGILFDLVVVIILALYFVAGFPRIKAAGYRLAPASQRLRVSDLGDKIFKQMGGYLAGATLIALQAGLVAGVFATIVGLPYPWAIALGAALLDFVPVVGPIVVGLSMVLIGFTQSLTIGIIAGAFYVLQHLFEAYWLYPKVMRRTVHITSGSVIVAILIGGALLGVTGALLAVPVAAAIQLIVREVLMPMQERR